MIPKTFKKIKIDNVEYDFVDISNIKNVDKIPYTCLLYTSPSPRDLSTSRMPSSA